MKASVLSPLLVFGLGGVDSFAPNTNPRRQIIITTPQKHIHSSKQQLLQTTLNIRGGEIKMLPVGDAISATLVSGSPLRAVGSLWAIASIVVVPLTFIQQSYSFSVGYGFSVAAMVCYLFDA
jgi:hypothetical protein